MGNLASGIESIPHLKAFDDLAADRLAAIDISVVLMLLVDQAPAAALPSLADQFDVLGYKGWALARNEQEKRDLIKKAIELHRYKGTEWAIIEAVKTVGFENASIVTGVGVNYDGAHNYDGSINYTGGHWAQFRVLITLPDNIGVNSVSLSDLTSLILQYKNARSQLVDISFRIEFTEGLALNDQFFELSGDLLSNQVSKGIDYDGLYNYDGSQTHDRLEEVFDLKIYNQFGELIG